MRYGVGGIVYLADADENINRVSTIGRIFLTESYPRIKTHSPINVTSASGGSSFETVSVGRVQLRSESGNGVMWWGGTSDDAPYSGHGMPLWGGETTEYLPVTNFNTIRIVASISGQIVYPIGFLNGSDSTLSNTTPTIPDNIAPFVVTHSPVSGLSGVALDSDITATFNEPIPDTAVVSGVFRLSPAHNVLLYRDPSDVTRIVMEPNVNLSGSTTYVAEVVSGGVFDVASNRVATRTTWPFTTTNAPPPPDTTPPVISGTSPTNGATSVDEDTSPTISFSETMLSGTINSTNIYLSLTSGGAKNPASITVTLSAVDNKTATIDPTASLAAGTVYYINATANVKDVAGNSMVADLGRSFTTIYNFTEVYNITGASTGDMYTGNNTRIGTEVLSTNPPIKGTAPKKFVLRLARSGSPTGTAVVRIRNGSDTIIATIGSVDVSTLSTSLSDVTFEDLTQSHVIATNDKILVEYTGTSNSSNKVLVGRLNSDGQTGTRYTAYDGSYTADGAKELAGIMYA